MKRSCSIANLPTHACVTECGVHSWHTNEADAMENARETDGRAVPVDYIDGELITPSAAVVALKRLGIESGD